MILGTNELLNVAESQSEVRLVLGPVDEVLRFWDKYLLGYANIGAMSAMDARQSTGKKTRLSRVEFSVLCGRNTCTGAA